MKTILRVESLKKHYGKEPNITKALNGISFQVVKGEFLGIMGSSGSGKTTLLNCLATIIKPTDGSIQMQENIIRLVVRKSPTGESTHYFFVMLK